MAQFPKRIPYGMMNFVDVREDNCYYVDKTCFIPLIEQANKFFFHLSTAIREKPDTFHIAPLLCCARGGSV